MVNEILNKNVLKYAAECYGISTTQLQYLRGGHLNHVYGFTKDAKNYVLRITPPHNEVDIQALRAILQWMHYLATHGASVPRPIVSRHNQLIESVNSYGKSYLIVVFEKARGILSEELSFNQWNDELYQNLGRAVGKMHALAKRYIPPHNSFRRPDWDSMGNCFNTQHNLDASRVVMHAQRKSTLKHIHTLPKDIDSYGLIHADLHFANFFVDLKKKTITIFDFDDCVYGWYVMDIAMLLFDVLVLYPGSDKEEFAIRFMKSLLTGYLTHNNITSFWMNQLPFFLKLLEIEIYAMVFKSYDPTDCDSWIGKFMPNRKQRIEADLPYVNVDFTGRVMGSGLKF
jgi:Ser/Thr protein kinase RdoA (MazF antagonist)